MAYSLQAIISSSSAFEETCFEGGNVVGLPQALSMLLFTRKFLEQRKFPLRPLMDDDAKTLPKEIEELCARIAGHSRAAYVEAEFFGGAGTQGCALFQEGRRTEDIQIHGKAVNHALRFLGVSVAGEYDEFAALGLGKFRDADSWPSI
jgi:hypothetical protein